MRFPWRLWHVFSLSTGKLRFEKTNSTGRAKKPSGFFQVRRWGGELKGNTRGREEIKNLQQEGETFYLTLLLAQYLPANMPGAPGKMETGAVRGAERPAAPTHPPPSWLRGGREALPDAWPGSLESERRRG